MKPPLYHPRYWLSWAAVWLTKGIGLLPLPLLWCLGTITGRLGYYLFASRRRIARRNIELCFPELSTGEVDRLTHRHFAALGVALFSTGVSWVASKKRLKKLIQYRNREYYDQAVADGRHIIFLAPHFLGLELGGMCFSLECPGVSMYRKIHDPVIDRQVYQGRCRYGGIMIEHKSSLKTLVRFLRQGLTFYYLPDQNPGRRRGIFVPFFGIQTATYPTLGRFAKLADAVVIPCCSRFLPYGKGVEIVFMPPLEPFPTDDPVADATLMNRRVEEGIRLMPEDYFWIHRRFKTRPAGETSLYEK
ncbi:MAG: lipid A biosynthesis acyltransferase [Pseudomonadota bacterium]|nr:lipid A biosynthesis acyltransferase [Pseudomonadota bacterium]